MHRATKSRRTDPSAVCCHLCLKFEGSIFWKQHACAGSPRVIKIDIKNVYSEFLIKIPKGLSVPESATSVISHVHSSFYRRKFPPQQYANKLLQCKVRPNTVEFPSSQFSRRLDLFPAQCVPSLQMDDACKHIALVFHATSQDERLLVFLHSFFPMLSLAQFALSVFRQICSAAHEGGTMASLTCWWPC